MWIKTFLGYSLILMLNLLISIDVDIVIFILFSSIMMLMKS